MGKTKTTEVSITSLRITAEDDWLKSYIDVFTDEVEASPQYRYLKGKRRELLHWMRYRGLPFAHIATPLDEVLASMRKSGQLEPIQIYKDMRINNGHKRAAVSLYLNFDKINAIIIPDDTKL